MTRTAKRATLAIALAIAMVVSMAAAPIAAADPGATLESVDDGATIASTDDGATIASADDGATIASTEYDVTCEFPVAMEDATGEEVALEAPPERITTTNPSAAQVLWEIGGQEQVVGLTDFALYLDGAEEREPVSADDFGVSIEAVVDTDPDLVLAPNATPTETVETLRDLDLTVYHFAEAESIEDVREKTRTIGQLTDNCEGAAETIAWMDANVDAVEAATVDADRPAMLHPLHEGWAAGDGTFINDMIRTAGGHNIAAEEFEGYQVLSDEVVIERDPELLLLTQGTQFLLEEEPFDGTTAGQNDATVVMPVHYLNQPAPRTVVYTVRNVTAEIHSDRYGEADFVTREEASELLDLDDAIDETDDAEPTAPADDGIPGFGISVAIVALLGVTALLFRGRT